MEVPNVLTLSIFALILTFNLCLTRPSRSRCIFCVRLMNYKTAQLKRGRWIRSFNNSNGIILQTWSQQDNTTANFGKGDSCGYTLKIPIMYRVT